MALNIKDPEAERLAAEVAALADETKTRAVRTALQERRERLALTVLGGRGEDALRRFLAEEAWPQVPAQELGRPITRRERERILGYGPAGV
jgi:antitoxin VapB